MAKRVGKPRALRAGRWSVHPRSKGNFVFSFDGCIRFDKILSYETSSLNLSMAQGNSARQWVGGASSSTESPTWDEEAWVLFGPQALLEEYRTLPSLKKGHLRPYLPSRS